MLLLTIIVDGELYSIMLDIKNVYVLIKDICGAIYYGGSRVDPVIDNPHDYDYICFAKPLQLQNLRRRLTQHNIAVAGSKQKHTSTMLDFSQIRAYPYTQITWFSYLDSLMIKVVGEDVCPKTDIIKEHRQEFIDCLKIKAQALKLGKIKNQKRWYHLLRGVYILMNNSYEVTPEQKQEINILHDQAEGYEQLIQKTADLVDKL